MKGTFDGLTFYYNKRYGWLIRRKGGPKGKDVRTKADFRRTRENSNEFVTCSKMASELRKQVMLLTHERDKTLYHRLFTVARELLKLDRISTRGNRQPKKVINTQEGLSVLKKFKVKKNLTLYQVLVERDYLKLSMGIARKKVQRSKARPVNRKKALVPVVTPKAPVSLPKVSRHKTVRKKAVRKVVLADG